MDDLAVQDDLAPICLDELSLAEYECEWDLIGRLSIQEKEAAAIAALKQQIQPSPTFYTMSMCFLNPLLSLHVL